MTWKEFEDLEIQMVFTSLLTVDTHDFKSKYIYIGSEMLSRKIVLDLIFCIQNQNDELLLYRGNWAHQMCLPALSSKFSYPLCQYISLTFLQDLPSTCELEHILSKVLQDLAPMMPFLSIISHYTAAKLYFLTHLSFFSVFKDNPGKKVSYKILNS